MKITIELEKTLEENAQKYFEKAKKQRMKAEGAKNAINNTEERLATEKTKAEEAIAQAQLQKPASAWYKKYRWSKTRNGHLLVALL